VVQGRAVDETDVQYPADLALARAAAAGAVQAVREVDERCIAAVDVAVRAVDASPAFLDEVRQALRVHLLVGEDGAPPRLASYAGRGPLVAWVRVAAVRVALNLKRSVVQARSVSVEDLLGELVASEPDPELRHLKTMYRAELAEALRATLAALSERPRALLRLHYVDGLRLAQIAALYRVHESTASRWVQGALDDVAAGARRRLQERLTLSPSSFDSVARMVRSNLDLSLSRLLR